MTENHDILATPTPLIMRTFNDQLPNSSIKNSLIHQSMMRRTIKRRLVKARIALHQTIQKILDINRKKKELPFHEDVDTKEATLGVELKVLNKIAEQQALMVKKYEKSLMEMEES